MASRKSGPARPKKEDDTPPPIYEKGAMESRTMKIVVLVVVGILAIMFILAFSFCLAGGIKYHQPRYFVLLINITLSTAVTGLLIFWFYRGTLASAMMWYIFVQGTFLFFQCVTTDIFAWYEHDTDTHSGGHGGGGGAGSVIPIITSTNSSNHTVTLFTTPTPQPRFHI